MLEYNVNHDYTREVIGVGYENSDYSQFRNPLEKDIPGEIKQMPICMIIKQYSGSTAYCVGEFFDGIWIPISLNRKSLERCGLREGDSFSWLANDKGIVRLKDITEHPRIFNETDEELRETNRVFESLRRKWRPEI